MVRRYITVEEQQLIIERANQRCKYCQCPMAYSAQPYVFEHVIPVAHGGETSLANLALACGDYNGHKYTKIEALDITTRAPTQLYNPRYQQWQEHFAWSDDYLAMIGLTPIGRATVEALKLNRQGVLNIRRLLRLAGQHPPTE